MIERVESEVPLRGVGEGNSWVGERKPAFNFVSLAPKIIGVDRWVYNSMVVKHDEFNKLNKDVNRNAILVEGKVNKYLVSFAHMISVASRSEGLAFSDPERE